MLKAVFFDMDDTLIDWSTCSAGWRDLTLMALQPLYTCLQDQQIAVPEIEALADAYMEQARQAWYAVSGPGWDSPRQVDVLRHTLKEVGISSRKMKAEEAIRLLRWGAAPGVAVFPDVRDVLAQLKAAKLKLALLTNAAQPTWMREAELKEFDLLHYFDTCLTAGDAGKLKPHPKPYRILLNRLEVSPHQAVHIGDNLNDDVGGAQAAGMRGIWLRHQTGAAAGRTEVKPNAIIERLAELPATLDLMYPGWRQAEHAQP